MYLSHYGLQVLMCLVIASLCIGVFIPVDLMDHKSLKQIRYSASNTDGLTDMRLRTVLFAMVIVQSFVITLVAVKFLEPNASPRQVTSEAITNTSY